MKMSEAKVGMLITDHFLFPRQKGEIVEVTNKLIYVLFDKAIASYSAVQFTRVVRRELQVLPVCPRATDGNSNKHMQEGTKVKIEDVNVGTQVVDVAARSVIGTVTKKTKEVIYVKWPFKGNSEQWDTEHAEQFLEIAPVKNFTTDTAKGRMSSKSTLNVHTIPRAPKAKLSPAIQKAFDHFGNAAMAWGLERDQGYGWQCSRDRKAI